LNGLLPGEAASTNVVTDRPVVKIANDASWRGRESTTLTACASFAGVVRRKKFEDVTVL
jgi:hypothetical protein